ALACGLAALARDRAASCGIATIVCSGGVLHNQLLAARLSDYLSDFTLLLPQQLPAGDGAIAYGQAVVAAARWQSQRI
ncbi:TPA: carbamoyltransferase HypF, partial [Klebsiella aerogenes]